MGAEAMTARQSSGQLASLRARLRELEREARALEPSARERRTLRRAVERSVEQFQRDVDALPGYIETPDRGAGLVDSPIREHGIPLEQVIEHIERDAVRPGAQPASGAHLAYIPGGPLYASALADFIGAITNKYAGLFFSGPGMVRMENMLLRWTADLVGYPASAGGNLASGGSIATLTAVVTAREAHGLRAADYPAAVVYLSDQTHHSTEKAVRIAGLAEAQVRRVPTDARSRMRPDALRDVIAEDRARGLRPWLIVATAGSTDTGAVDPLDDIADVAQQQGCWFHVDAAYGGFFLLTEQGRARMRGIERSDSVVLDPHKGLFLPWGTGVVLVRDVRLLAAAHQSTGNYLQDALRDPGEVSPADVSPELTKPFRALRMWMPLVLLGTKPFRAALEEKLLLARYFRLQIEKGGFEVGPEPDLSIVTFRWAPAAASLEATNRFNQAIVEAMRHDGRVFLSSTMLDGRFTLRMVALQFRTHRRTIDLAVRILRETALAVAAQA